MFFFVVCVVEIKRNESVPGKVKLKKSASLFSKSFGFFFISAKHAYEIIELSVHIAVVLV